MPVPVTNDPAPDVLEGREPAAGRTWRVPVSVVAGGLALALVGGAAVVFSTMEDGWYVDG